MTSAARRPPLQESPTNFGGLKAAAPGISDDPGGLKAAAPGVFQRSRRPKRPPLQARKTRSGNRKCGQEWLQTAVNTSIARFAFFVIVGLAIQAAAQPAFVSEFEIAGFSCDGCAATASDALKKVPGVTRVDVTFATRRGRVESTRQIAPAEIRTALGKFGFEARFAGDVVVAPLTPRERAALDIKVASKGEAFILRDHLARGKFTIIDFWAEWCGPCHVLTPKIEHLVKERADVALRTVDLQNWESGAAKQATKEFKLAALPYVRVYGPDGKFIGDVVGNDIEKIKRLIAERSR